MRRPYTQEEVYWLVLVSGWHKNYKTLYECFCEKFPKREYKAFRQKCKQLGISKPNSLYYTEEEKIWILTSFTHSCSMKLLYERFCCFFPRRTFKGFEKMCRYELGLFTSKQYTSYRKEHQLPIGTERNGADGRVYVKCKLIPNSCYIKDQRFKLPYWKPKQVKVYEDYYGQIPRGNFVIFLNGDIHDFRIENLYCIDRRILQRMARNKFFSANNEITKTGIKYCELMQTLKGVKNG